MKRLYFMTIAVMILVLASCGAGGSGGEAPGQECQLRLGVMPQVSIQGDGVAVRGGRGYQMPDGYRVRYVLEAWTSGAQSKCAYRTIEMVDDIDYGVEFSMRLVKGTYDFLIWADFIEESDLAGADNHYDTSNSLKQIKVKNLNYTTSDASRDAFAARIAGHTVDESLSLNVTMQRPLAKLEVVNSGSVAMEADKVVGVDFSPALPDMYDMLRGVAFVSSDGGLTPRFVNSTTSATIAWDYILVSAVGKTSYYCLCAYDQKTVASVIPLQANTQTNVTANFTGNVAP